MTSTLGPVINLSSIFSSFKKNLDSKTTLNKLCYMLSTELAQIAFGDMTVRYTNWYYSLDEELDIVHSQTRGKPRGKILVSAQEAIQTIIEQIHKPPVGCQSALALYGFEKNPKKTWALEFLEHAMTFAQAGGEDSLILIDVFPWEITTHDY